MRILCLHRQPTAVGYYRTILRARMLRKLGHEVTYSEHQTYHDWMRPRGPKQDGYIDEWFRSHVGKYDLLLVDRALHNREWGTFAGFRHYSPDCRMVVDFDDDFTSVPKWNPARSKYQPGQEAHTAGFSHLRLSEMTTVSTEALRKRFAPAAHAIRVLPNLIDPADWADLPLDPTRSDDKCLRVLYGGANGHYGDLDAVRGGLEAQIHNPPVPWRLICFGAAPNWLTDLSITYPDRVVILPWIPFPDYAQAVAWGGFDIAIAPLAEHIFNASKSNIKWLESAIQGLPFLCSRVGPYAEIPDGCAVRVENTAAQWASGLHSLLIDKDFRLRLAEEAKQNVLENWTVDAGLKRLQITIEEAASLPRIETEQDTRLPSDPLADLLVPAEGQIDAEVEPEAPHVESDPDGTD